MAFMTVAPGCYTIFKQKPNSEHKTNYKTAKFNYHKYIHKKRIEFETKLTESNNRNHMYKFMQSLLKEKRNHPIILTKIGIDITQPKLVSEELALYFGSVHQNVKDDSNCNIDALTYLPFTICFSLK